MRVKRTSSLDVNRSFRHDIVITRGCGRRLEGVRTPFCLLDLVFSFYPILEWFCMHIDPLRFEMGEPYKPFQQLMSVMPSAYVRRIYL